ncbi:Cft2 family RNA processing exonuclease [Aequitasia blattaphilus]|uniref:Uncharacterized protein n=1 Tax=Aequitasia blattaphilus TaxID=2949332 RepID=A0ABT1EBX7_9FIRM|nr:hypothetical protein [Aequitasia blattaphilus]MCP1103351.1 hypothetical protein [Aequitasia blattaphilus]MCR8615991.1 hypothetical protein [Aequitasia blattaphilus]
MKEHKFTIENEKIILTSPEMIEILVRMIRESTERSFRLLVDSLVAQRYLEYMKTVINTNIEYHFFQIKESEEVNRWEIYQAIADQMQKVQVNSETAFMSFKLIKGRNGLLYDVVPSEYLFNICKGEFCRKFFLNIGGKKYEICV